MGMKQKLSNLLGFRVQGTGYRVNSPEPRTQYPEPRLRVNRVSPSLSSKWQREWGVGQSWTPLSYGEYYPRSALVYSAIKVRQDAIVRVPLRVGVRGTGFRVQGESRPNPEPRTPNPVPLQRLLDAPNPFWTRGDLWRATETYLSLWGSSYWGLERDERGQVVEIWPLRSDRMRVIPDSSRYIKGFVYVGQGVGANSHSPLVPYLPEDIVWIHYFNPLDEYAGLSPIAPLRLSADMGLDALRASRNSLANDSTPGLIVETADTPTDDEVREFYERWESRFRGADKVRRPVLLSAGMKASSLGFSPSDMQYIQSLRWSLEDVARVFGVPKAMLGDIERITFSNFHTARRVFWEDTIVPQLRFYEEALQQMLVPNFGDPSLFVQFDLSAVEALQESENDKAKRRELYVNAGIMTVNEVRQEMALPPLE
jgi:HK97 family phage portal protein